MLCGRNRCCCCCCWLGRSGDSSSVASPKPISFKGPESSAVLPPVLPPSWMLARGPEPRCGLACPPRTCARLPLLLVLVAASTDSGAVLLSPGVLLEGCPDGSFTLDMLPHVLLCIKPAAAAPLPAANAPPPGAVSEELKLGFALKLAGCEVKLCVGLKLPG